MTKQYTHIEIHPSGRVDPDKSRMICENPGCGQEFVIADAFSFVTVCWALTGPEARFSSQCPEEQHFACSPQCARAVAIQCIDEHLFPLHAATVQAVRASKSASADAQNKP